MTERCNLCAVMGREGCPRHSYAALDGMVEGLRDRLTECRADALDADRIAARLISALRDEPASRKEQLDGIAIFVRGWLDYPDSVRQEEAMTTRQPATEAGQRLLHKVYVNAADILAIEAEARAGALVVDEPWNSPVVRGWLLRLTNHAGAPAEVRDAALVLHDWIKP